MTGLMRTLSIVALIAAFSVALPVAARAADHGDKAAEKDDGEHHGKGHDYTPNEVPLAFKADLAVWSIITFVIFLGVLRVFAWKPLQSGLADRESRILKNIAEAESARVKAEQMLADHERKLAKVHDEVRDILAEARRDADTARANIIADATKEAEATRQRAVADIDRAKNQALSELFDRAANRVIEASENVIGRSLRDEDHIRLVEEALAQVSSKA